MFFFFFSVVIISSIVSSTCVLFKVTSYLFKCFSIMSIFAKYIIQVFYFHPQIFSEHIFVALARNPLNMPVIVSGGILDCGLICMFVRAGLRWTSNSYLPLLFFIFMSRKFKHFSPFSSSIVNWICLSCLFKISKERCQTKLTELEHRSEWLITEVKERIEWCSLRHCRKHNK